MIILGIEQIEKITFEMAREMMTYNEPIPDFSTRIPNILESCLAMPFQTYDLKDLYPTFVSKASILFYLMIKNHPFENGNKRIAMTTLFTFLYANNKWLVVDTQKLYNFTVWVAGSDADFKEEVVTAIEKFIKKHMIERK